MRVINPMILMANMSLCDPIGPMRIVHKEGVRCAVPRRYVFTEIVASVVFT